MTDKEITSRIKINYKTKPISSNEKQMIVNFYKSKLEKNPTISVKECTSTISKELGIREKVISNAIAEYYENKMATSPNNKRIKLSWVDCFDEFHLNLIRRHVHSFWFEKQKPTIDNIYTAVSNDDALPTVSRKNFLKLLKVMDFKFNKRKTYSAVIEKSKVVLWRRRYLQDLNKYREEGRHIYYLGETFVSAGESTKQTWVNPSQTVKTHCEAFLRGVTTSTENPLVKGNGFIVFHIGSEDGFVEGALQYFKAKKNSVNVFDAINVETYSEWIKSVLPRLKENSVIVLDNAWHHSVKINQAPTSKNKKNDIIQWLENNGQVLDSTMVVPELLEIVRRIKPLHEKYFIDVLVKEHGHSVLRIPPYHCHLNPIERAWFSIKNYVKTNNSTFKLPDVKILLVEGVERINAEMWIKFLKHAKKEENKCWEVDFIVDEMLSAEARPYYMPIIDDTTSDSD